MLEQKLWIRDDAEARLREDRLLEWKAAESRDYHALVQRRKQRGEAGIAPPREHDERVVYPRFDDHILAMLEHWNALDNAVFRQLAEQGRDYVIQHNRFPDIKMLRGWFAELKRRHPEYNELPREIPSAICHSMSELLRQFMYARRKDPTVVFEVERRRNNCFYFDQVRILWEPQEPGHHCDNQEVAIVLPKLGEVIAVCSKCPLDEDYQYGTLAEYFLAINWRGETSYKLRGARVWKSPTTRRWYITLKFERFFDMQHNPPKNSPIRGELLCPVVHTLYYDGDDYWILRTIRETFDAKQAKLLSAKEICEALAAKDIPINDKSLAEVLRASLGGRITSQMTKHNGKGLMRYHREDFVKAWEIVDNLLRGQQEFEESKRQDALRREAEQQRRKEHQEFMQRYDAYVAAGGKPAFSDIEDQIAERQRIRAQQHPKLMSNSELARLWMEKMGIYAKPLINQTELAKTRHFIPVEADTG